MNKEEFEKLFTTAAEKSGVAELARKNQFAENLEAMMCELRDKLNSLPAELVNFDEAEKEYGKYVDDCLNKATKRFFSNGEDAYSVADLFHAGVECGASLQENASREAITMPLAERIKGKIEQLKGEVNYHENVLSVLNRLKVYIDIISADQPSEELEKAATALTDEIVGGLNVWDYTDHSGHNAHWHSFKEGVVAGAQWQKEQMMKSAIDGCHITRNRYNKENVLNGFSVTCDTIQKFKDGDKVRVIVIKEDE